MNEAIRKYRNGVAIDIEVSPNSKEEAIRGYNPWRKRIIVSMKEKPEKFRVNREIVKFFSNLLGVPQGNVRIISGEKDPRKTVYIEGVTEDVARSAIERAAGKKVQ